MNLKITYGAVLMISILQAALVGCTIVVPATQSAGAAAVATGAAGKESVQDANIGYQEYSSPTYTYITPTDQQSTVSPTTGLPVNTYYYPAGTTVEVESDPAKRSKVKIEAVFYPEDRESLATAKALIDQLSNQRGAEFNGRLQSAQTLTSFPNNAGSFRQDRTTVDSNSIMVRVLLQLETIEFRLRKMDDVERKITEIEKKLAPK